MLSKLVSAALACAVLAMLLAPLSYFAYLQAQALVDPLFKMALLSTPYRPEECLSLIHI